MVVNLFQHTTKGGTEVELTMESVTLSDFKHNNLFVDSYNIEKYGLNVTRILIFLFS
jgi:hypothetical protein